jgi:hypothetical protein
MTFLTPLLAGIAAAIAIPSLIILYFLRLRRNEVEVSSTLLWKKAIEDLQANAPFQRLRRNLLLFLQLIVLALILFAIAQPQIASTFAPGVQHVIIIDRSASMQATDGDPSEPGKVTRLDAAKKKANELVDSLRDAGAFSGEGDRAMVVAMDVSGTVMQQFTSNKNELKRAIERITPADTSTLMEPAFKVAKAFLPKRIMMDNAGGTGPETPIKMDEQTVGQVTIHLFSDGQIPDIGLVRPQGDATKAELQDDKLEYHAIGSPDAWNVGIVALRAERSFDKPSELQVFVGVQSTASEPKSVDVQLAIDGTASAVKALKLPAAAKAADGNGIVPAGGGLVFKVDRPTGGVVSIQLKLDAPDALPVDDYAYVVVPPARRMSVALVTPGNAFLRDVLERANLSRKLLLVSPAQGDEFLASKQAEEYDVLVLDRWLPTLKPGQQGLPAGRFLIFGAYPEAPMGLIKDGEPEGSIVLSWERDHPVMRAVGLDNLQVSKAQRTKLPERGLSKVLAMGSAGPLICETSTTSTRAIYTTFDTLASNWPLDSGFVIYVLSALNYLSQEGGETGALLVRPGGQIDQRLPESAAEVRLVDPEKASTDIVLSTDNRATFGPIQRTGIYTLSWKGPAVGSDQESGGRVRRFVASNLSDPRESDIRALTTLETKSRVVQASDEKSAGVRRYWPWLLLGALGMITLEWFIYNRKVML